MRLLRHFTHGNHCIKLVVIDRPMTATAEKELYTYQEEADTRMFLYESHASLHEHQTVSIVSSDTHVKELICHHQSATPAERTLIGAARKRF